MSNLKSGYIEQFIHDRQQQLWDAYLSIDINPLYGWERPCPKIQHCLSNNTEYFGVKDYFEQCNASEIEITEKDVMVNQFVIIAILESITGKNIQVHLKVHKERVAEINDLLFRQVSAEATDGMCFIHWLNFHDDHVLNLKKRLAGWNEYNLRLYNGGDGVIIYQEKDTLITHYFRLADDLWNKVKSICERETAQIISHPTVVHEDDRYFCSIHLTYGLTWLHPHAYENLGSGYRYENTEYPHDENDLPIVKLLMESKEIRSKWLHMHDNPN